MTIERPELVRGLVAHGFVTLTGLVIVVAVVVPRWETLPVWSQLTAWGLTIAWCCWEVWATRRDLRRTLEFLNHP